MNRVHQWLCSSRQWARGVEDRYLPWALARVQLGEDVLEIGPGYGATTRVLARGPYALTALEIDPLLAARVRDEHGARVHVVTGDGAAQPFEDARFSAVVCFTMLHHVPSHARQDQLFTEAFRVLRPGGVFAGADSLPSFGFRMLHIGDTMVLVDPDTLPARLHEAGFRDIEVGRVAKAAFRFRARRPIMA